MKVLFTGRGTSGSWQIRGIQLGTAIGAHVEPLTIQYKADLVIGVKRVSNTQASSYRGRLIWDVVDAWPQPYGNEWDEAACKQWLANEVERIKPVGFIAATKQMASDLAVFGLPILWLPHHYRPWNGTNEIRKEVKVIGYEGGAAYIGGWRPTIEKVCRQVGASFVVNPVRLVDLDIVLALRGATGYAPRKWKSGVKMSNAHGTGTPFIGSPEAGYLELATGLECWADKFEDLAPAVGSLMDRARRIHVQEEFLKARLSLEEVAGRLKDWLGRF